MRRGQKRKWELENESIWSETGKVDGLKNRKLLWLGRKIGIEGWI